MLSAYPVTVNRYRAQTAYITCVSTMDRNLKFGILGSLQSLQCTAARAHKNPESPPGRSKTFATMCFLNLTKVQNLGLPQYSSRVRVDTSSRYAQMCVEAYEMPPVYNAFSWLFSWIALAGFLVFPTTFSSLSILGQSYGSEVIRHTLQSLPLLRVAVACCILGLGGTLILCLYCRRNVIWWSSTCL